MGRQGAGAAVGVEEEGGRSAESQITPGVVSVRSRSATNGEFDRIARYGSECVLSRKRPMSEIATCACTTTGLLFSLSLRNGIALEWDEKRFTVKAARSPKPFLGFKCLFPWKPEV